jgi:hypothetical protein
LCLRSFFSRSRWTIDNHAHRDTALYPTSNLPLLPTNVDAVIIIILLAIMTFALILEFLYKSHRNLSWKLYQPMQKEDISGTASLTRGTTQSPVPENQRYYTHNYIPDSMKPPKVLSGRFAAHDTLRIPSVIMEAHHESKEGEPPKLDHLSGLTSSLNPSAKSSQPSHHHQEGLHSVSVLLYPNHSASMPFFAEISMLFDQYGSILFALFNIALIISLCVTLDPLASDRLRSFIATSIRKLACLYLWWFNSVHIKSAFIVLQTMPSYVTPLRFYSLLLLLFKITQLTC